MDRLSIPQNDGETLLVPPLSEYGSAINTNRAASRQGISIGGEPFEKIAERAKANALALAKEYTHSLGLNAGGNTSADAPVIASGHQPEMFHPGVAAKNYVLAKTAKDLGAVPLFISVDFDEFTGQYVETPSIEDGKLALRESPLFPQDSRGATFETAKVEPASATLERLREILRHLNSPQLEKPREALSRFMERLEGANLNTPDFTSRAILMRRVWEQPLGVEYLELKASSLCEGEPFLKFASDIIARLAEFTSAYNGELADYRKKHKLRYPANPFPDLARKGSLYETPFWAVTTHGRERLYATGAAAGDVELVTDSGVKTTLGKLSAGGFKIRPKALALSMYMRLFVCDFFIHGVGGAKYDKVADGIIKRYYGITPPRYGCVSATFWPEIAFENPASQIEETRRALRNIEQKPETVLERGPETEALFREKEALVAEIAKPGADKKAISGKINGLNENMRRLLTPMEERLKLELAAAERSEKEWRVASGRSYPFFIYQPERLLKLSE